MNRVEPSGNFQTQSYGAGLLQPGAAGEQSGLMRFGDFSERAGKLREFALQQIQSVAQLQDQAGINRVLAGGAPVDETGGLRIGFRDRRGERLHQRNREISGEGCFARQDVQRKMIRATLRDDGRYGSVWRDACARQCSRQAPLRNRACPAVCDDPRKFHAWNRW